MCICPSTCSKGSVVTSSRCCDLRIQNRHFLSHLYYFGEARIIFSWPGHLILDLAVPSHSETNYLSIIITDHCLHPFPKPCHRPSPSSIVVAKARPHHRKIKAERKRSQQRNRSKQGLESTRARVSISIPQSTEETWR